MHAALRTAALLLALPLPVLAAQRPGGPARPDTAKMRQAIQLDLDGRTAEAQAVFQRLLDSTADPAARAQVARALAMSHAFAGDCAGTLRYEQQVIDYWKTREAAEPQNAFFQEGEIADEGARVCIDAGDFASAEAWYRRGDSLGLLEPAPRTHPASLWAFRLAHALGRLAARRGDAAEAGRQVARAREALAADSATNAQQQRFLPYLTGYVALYTGDLTTALADLTDAVARPGNERDPYLRCLLALTEERMGRRDQADADYRKAYDLATGHNPPSAFVRPLVRKKLGL